ncbi:MAG: adhesin transport system membrane fusion protein [Myxococcota bacterium]|jgi:adhesin transport system membrane fusion protein
MDSMRALSSARLERRLRAPRTSGQTDGILSGIQPPLPMRWVAGGLLAILPLLAALMLLTPWQQAALGTGRVIAFAPGDRQQVLDAPIDARVQSWHVSEGQVVRAGDLLATLADPDPDYAARLAGQRDAAATSVAAAEAQIRSYAARSEAAAAQVAFVVAEYNRKIASLQHKRIGEASELDVEGRNLGRQQTLAGEGISSQRTLDVAELKQAKARASLDALDQEIAATVQARDKARAEATAKAASAEADLEASRAKLADAQMKLADAETKLARQDGQSVRAVQDGTVLKVYGGPGSWVKKGDPIVSLIPTTTSRAVELKIDGNDAPLIQPGESVRLVFEGWPALQFVGLRDSKSPGTFPGRVALIDATDDESGKFRIVVVPTGELDWPDSAVLRQGTRTKGWVLLGQVSLGYELWRQINGFPALPPTEKGNKPTLPSNKKPRAPAALH